MFAHQQSSLNPDAPMFAPMAYQAVEDFSDQWWSLIQPSTWFRDYWLQERYQDPQLTSSSPTTSISSTKVLLLLLLQPRLSSLSHELCFNSTHSGLGSFLFWCR
ncbi:unnamed protein product [Linum tenue]|uniref:Ataxin-2 C-terminal domain-containing protein n=1 Tax=Linum tenue TaxID=586396 RepID=A0AAV0MDV2_9ROSI|nr:unnamed protein product [Linum tenue]